MLTTLNVLILGVAGYKGLQVMDSVGFCGSCHSVMDPEVTAYQRSPHARVGCVQCHIGEGASWFVKSKLSGAWQLISVTFDLYQRPIPVPIHNLRPAQETCEECHWPSKFTGDRLRITTHYAEDQANTEKKTVALLHVGGGQSATGPIKGIHAHVAQGVHIRYLSDANRNAISTVEATWADGKTVLFRTKDSPATLPPAGAWRTMDCVDCHNRPTHRFREPGPGDRRGHPGPPDRRRAPLDQARGARGHPGDLPRPRGGTGRDREADHRLLPEAGSGRLRRPGGRGERGRGGRSATSTPGTSGPR